MSAKALADEAQYSVAETYRRFRSEGVPAPIRTRKRLLLERAAYELTTNRRTVSEIGLDAGYESLEGFSRSFRRAYGVAPRDYRRLAPTDYCLGKAALHFAPAPSSLDRRQGQITMTLLDLILDDHKRQIHRALDVYEGLTEDQRNETIKNIDPFPWEPDDLSLAQLVSRNCGFGEPWIHQLDGEPKSQYDGTVPSLRARLEENDRRFKALVRKIEQEGSWDLTFVDAECDPPEVFTYGLIANMQIVYTSHQRVCLEQHLRQLGHPISFV